MLSNRNLMDNNFCTTDKDHPEKEVYLNILPIHHVFCINGDVFTVMRYGSVLCLNRDMARLAACAVKNETLVRLCSTRSVTVGGRTMTNHNRLLRAVPGCIGMKTGYTRAAGRTLVSAAERDGRRLVAVTLQDGNDWADHAALYDWGFAQPAGQETADHRREDTP